VTHGGGLIRGFDSCDCRRGGSATVATDNSPRRQPYSESSDLMAQYHVHCLLTQHNAYKVLSTRPNSLQTAQANYHTYYCNYVTCAFCHCQLEFAQSTSNGSEFHQKPTLDPVTTSSRPVPLDVHKFSLACTKASCIIIMAWLLASLTY